MSYWKSANLQVMYEIYLVYLDSYFLIPLQQPWNMIPEKFRILKAKQTNREWKTEHVAFTKRDFHLSLAKPGKSKPITNQLDYSKQNQTKPK